jgi:hypothetical protein
MARRPESAELHRLLLFYREQMSQYSADGDAARKSAGENLPAGVSPAEAAAWMALARVLVNLDEFITRE